MSCPIDLLTTLAQAPAWVRTLLSWFALLWAIATATTLFLRAVPPERFDRLEAAWPAGGKFFRALRKLGTDWVPFLRELGGMVLAVIKALGKGGGGAAVVILVLAGTLAHQGCSGSAVDRQATVAHTSATIWSGAGEPALVRAFEGDQRKALDEVCPDRCDFTTANNAVERVRARWAPFWALTEQVRGDHDAWRTQLAACRRALPDGGTCNPRIDVLAGLFYERFGQWRCTLRALGHADLDKFPGTPTCNGANDGGRE